MSPKLSVVKKPGKSATITKAPPREVARNKAIAKLVQAFTLDVKALGKKYGIQGEDLKVFVQIQIPDQKKGK